MRHLARVHPSTEQGRSNGEELTRFCTHCAELFAAPTAPPDKPSRGRVCGNCGLGVILTCSSATLTAPRAAFLVVTADLRVSAASRAAEDLAAIPDGSYGRPLLSLLTSPAGIGELARAVIRAANGTLAPSTIPVLVASKDLEARIGGCGNPPAALLVLEPAAS